MKFRLLTHVLVLGLFITATMLAALVSPARAGYADVDQETMQAMSPDMACCPPLDEKQSDCMTNCPAVTFCLAKCFASAPAAYVALARPIIAELELSGDDTERVSRPFEPPARPPRT